MAGLLCKDWLLLRRQLWYYALLLGLYLTLTAAGVLDASFLCGLAVLYGTLLPTTCFSYDEAVHWERYAAATPAGRRGTVDGKYLLALLLAALSGGISLFLTALMEGPESALSLAVLVCTGLALAVNAVNLPLLLLLGVSRSRAALYFVFILFFGGGMALLLLFQRGLLPPPTPGLAAALPWLVGIYQEYSRDPVVLRFADMILAVVCAVLALYFAASFAFRHPRPRLCLFFSLMGIVLNLEALANGQSLFFTALTAAAVLVLLAQSWALLRTCFGPAWPECLLEDRMPSGALERAEGDNAPGGAGVENHHREDD